MKLLSKHRLTMFPLAIALIVFLANACSYISSRPTDTLSLHEQAGYKQFQRTPFDSPGLGHFLLRFYDNEAPHHRLIDTNFKRRQSPDSFFQASFPLRVHPTS